MSTQTPQVHTQGATPSTQATRSSKQDTRLVSARLGFRVLVAYLDRVKRFRSDRLSALPGRHGAQEQSSGTGLIDDFLLVSYGLGNILLGPIGDRLGPRKAMSIALITWAVPLLIAATAKTVTVLYASMFILGLEKRCIPMQIALVKNWFPQQERGKANSTWLLGQMVGPALGMSSFAAVMAV